MDLLTRPPLVSGKLNGNRTLVSVANSCQVHPSAAGKVRSINHIFELMKQTSCFYNAVFLPIRRRIKEKLFLQAPRYDRTCKHPPVFKYQVHVFLPIRRRIKEKLFLQAARYDRTCKHPPVYKYIKHPHSIHHTFVFNKPIVSDTAVLMRYQSKLTTPSVTMNHPT